MCRRLLFIPPISPIISLPPQIGFAIWGLVLGCGGEAQKKNVCSMVNDKKKKKTLLVIIFYLKKNTRVIAKQIGKIYRDTDKYKQNLNYMR